MFSVRSGNPLSLIMGFRNKTLHYLDIVDPGATITLNKIRKTNQTTITQSRDIYIYVFETSLIQLNQKILLYIILTSNVNINGICMRYSECKIRMNKNPTLAHLIYFSDSSVFSFQEK